MLGLWRDEVDISELADEPRWFIEGLLRGEPEELSAQRAGATMEDVRRWSTDGKFRLALKRARRGIGCTTVTAGTAHTAEDCTVTIRPDGTTEVSPNGVVSEPALPTTDRRTTVSLEPGKAS